MLQRAASVRVRLLIPFGATRFLLLFALIHTPGTLQIHLSSVSGMYGRGMLKDLAKGVKWPILRFNANRARSLRRHLGEILRTRATPARSQRELRAVFEQGINRPLRLTLHHIRIARTKQDLLNGKWHSTRDHLVHFQGRPHARCELLGTKHESSVLVHL